MCIYSQEEQNILKNDIRALNLNLNRSTFKPISISSQPSRSSQNERSTLSSNDVSSLEALHGIKNTPLYDVSAGITSSVISPDRFSDAKINRIAYGLRSNRSCSLTYTPEVVAGGFFEKSSYPSTDVKIGLSREAILPYGEFNLDSEMNYSYILPHELRHLFFEERRQKGIHSAYDGYINSAHTDEVIPYSGHFSFEELFNHWKGCQLIARQICSENITSPERYIRLGQQLTDGAELADRAFHCIKSLSESTKPLKYIFDPDMPKSILLSVRETVLTTKDNAIINLINDTNVSLPLVFYDESLTFNDQISSEQVKIILDNALDFISGYRELFISSFKAWKNQSIAESDLIAPLTPNPLDPHAEEKKKEYFKRMHHVYAFDRFTTKVAETKRPELLVTL